MNKNPTDATVCRYIFTAKLLYMFRVSQHPSSGVLKTLPAASGTGHNTCTATPIQRGLIWTGLCESRATRKTSMQVKALPCFNLHTDTTPPQPYHNVTPTHIEPDQCNP